MPNNGASALLATTVCWQTETQPVRFTEAVKALSTTGVKTTVIGLQPADLRWQLPLSATNRANLDREIKFSIRFTELESLCGPPEQTEPYRAGAV